MKYDRQDKLDKLHEQYKNGEIGRRERMGKLEGGIF
jgi:hypothetical protein